MHVSEHLANERTFLAFFRTAVSLASFGITINRFALYLIQQKVRLPAPPGFGALAGAEDAGIGMVILGGLLMIFASTRYFSVSASIEAGTYVPRKGFAIVITALVVLGSGAALTWLFTAS